MNLSIQSATDREPAQLVALLNRGFGDYLVPIAFDVPMFYHMIRHDGVDLGASRVVQCDGE
ncbi:MAG: hypothetical protein KJ734_08675, partial [Chloroflexi bacterium]|nr:hypothetical protein [Chloroflexota bacterium]